MPCAHTRIVPVTSPDGIAPVDADESAPVPPRPHPVNTTGMDPHTAATKARLRITLLLSSNRRPSGQRDARSHGDLSA
ncbi:hypothetical protein GCM10022245_34100 [Streptomyces mayteni]